MNLVKLERLVLELSYATRHTHRAELVGRLPILITSTDDCYPIVRGFKLRPTMILPSKLDESVDTVSRISSLVDESMTTLVNECFALNEGVGRFSNKELVSRLGCAPYGFTESVANDPKAIAFLREMANGDPYPSRRRFCDIPTMYFGEDTSVSSEAKEWFAANAPFDFAVASLRCPRAVSAFVSSSIRPKNEMEWALATGVVRHGEPFSCYDLCLGALSSDGFSDYILSLKADDDTLWSVMMREMNLYHTQSTHIGEDVAPFKPFVRSYINKKHVYVSSHFDEGNQHYEDEYIW